MTFFFRNSLNNEALNHGHCDVLGTPVDNHPLLFPTKRNRKLQTRVNANFVRKVNILITIFANPSKQNFRMVQVCLSFLVNMKRQEVFTHNHGKYLPDKTVTENATFAVNEGQHKRNEGQNKRNEVDHMFLRWSLFC